MLEVALSAEHNTKTTLQAGVLELVSDTQGIVSLNFRNRERIEESWGGWD